ncbi:MAG: hydroxymethylglutaryl-CoA lyase [Rhodothermales bacterium]
MRHETRHVSLCEVGPRDGFQFESKPIPTERKVEWIRRLAAAGLPRVQVTSFVHPGRVPQMADADEVVAGVAGLPAVATGLALNLKGVERAAASGLHYVDLSIATNERHGRDNANMSVEEGVEQAFVMVRRAWELGLEVQMGFQTVWGYGQPGDTPMEQVVDLARRFAALAGPDGRRLESMSLADSTGMANPASIRRVVEAVQAAVREGVPDENAVPLVLHLHDTRGLGVANVIAALDAGVRRFDTSLGGLGGCPFIPGATGNVATEDVAYALRELGWVTGVDIGAVSEVTREVAAFLGRPLSGRVYGLDVARQE